MTVLGGSPINRADLRAVKVNLCRSCIILSAKAPDKLEPVLADKEIIMAALNIKSMDFKQEQVTDLEQIKVIQPLSLSCEFTHTFCVNFYSTPFPRLMKTCWRRRAL